MQDINLLDPYKISGKTLLQFHMNNDAGAAEINLRQPLSNEEAKRWIDQNWVTVNVWRHVGDVVCQ